MSDTFITADLQFATYLLAMGAEMPTIRLSGNRCQFNFDDQEGDIAWLREEWAVSDENRAQCSAPKLFASLHKLRKAMDEAKRQV